MGAVLAAIAVPLGLVLLLLAVPVDVAFRLQGIEAFQGQITIRWLLGLVRLRIGLPGSRKPPPAPGAEPRGAGARVRPRKRGRRTRIVAVLREASFRQRTFRLVRDLARAARVRQLRLRVRLGLGDPADTGRLWAFVGPLTAVARYPPNVAVRIEPEFADPVLEFQADGRLVLVPLRFLALAIAFALSPPSIRAWRTLRGSHA